jgi:hypothetical protein
MLVRVDSSDLDFVDDYLNFVNGFTRKWEGYAKEAYEALIDADIERDFYAPKYVKVKKYIYADYDYASILQFTDGVIRGISEEKFKTNEDIVEFMNHTTSKAFKGLGPTTADILTDISEALSVTEADKDNIKSIKRYDFVDRDDRAEIYKSIEKVLKYLINDIENSFSDGNNMFNYKMLSIAMINAVIEYATYTLIAYAGRIYVYREFVSPYVDGSARPTDVAVSESANTESIGRRPLTLMKDANDLSFRDPLNAAKTINILKEFISTIGYAESPEPKNDILTEVVGNKLFKLLSVSPFDDGVYSDYVPTDDKPTNIIEYNYLLSQYIQNPTQSIDSFSSPKNELIDFIKNIKPTSETVEGYVSIAGKLATAFFEKFRHMNIFIRNKTAQNADEDYKANLSPAEAKALANAVTLTTQIYEEIADALLFKMRDIEMKINILKGIQNENIFNDLSISVPGTKNDYSHDDNMRMIVPISGSDSIQLEYAELPAFEFYEMYDEYARNLPGMKDCLYYSEAFDFSRLINAIVSALDNIIGSLTKLLANNSVKNAAEYVSRNQAKLKSMPINGKMENIVPFKKDISLQFISTYINNINTFNADALTTDEDINKYFAGIFGDDKITTIFDETKVNKNNTFKVFCNYVACGVDPNGNATGQINYKTLDGDAQIKREMDIWIDNVITYRDGLDAVSNKMKELKNAINGLKVKISSAGNQNAAQNNATTGAPQMDIGNDEAAGAQPAPQENNQAEQAQKEAKLQSAVVRLQATNAKLTSYLMRALVFSLKTQYTYIQQAEKMSTQG